MIYLAVPYSHPDPDVRQERFEAVNRAAAYLIRQGEMVFSPISHSHPINEIAECPTGWEYWGAFDTEVLSHCSELIVLTLDGWQDSVGVRAEMDIALELNMPVHLLTWAEVEERAGERVRTSS